MNWTTRAMTTGDWAMVSAIYKEGIDSRLATFRKTLPTQEEWYQSHLAEGKLILENEHGETCGFTCLSKLRALEAYRGFVEPSIYIANDCQNQGAGKFLLNALIAESETCGFWSLVSWIFTKNEPSIKLHEACGFRIVGTHEKAGKLDGKWQDVVVMERRSPLF